MRWSTVVLRSDVVEAIRLMEVATQKAATDPRTGTIDMDMITTGRSTVNPKLAEAIKDLGAKGRCNDWHDGRHGGGGIHVYLVTTYVLAVFRCCFFSRILTSARPCACHAPLRIPFHVHNIGTPSPLRAARTHTHARTAAGLWRGSGATWQTCCSR